MTTILTLELNAEAAAHFENLRQLYFPPELNRVPAHLSLFHKLPPLDEITETIRRAAHRQPFTLQVTGLRSLGRGVAFTLQSAELTLLHRELSLEFAAHLTPQDRQPFRPHVVIQNKATPETARQLLATLQPAFKPFEVTAAGLTVWNYLNGPWERAGFFSFR